MNKLEIIEDAADAGDAQYVVCALMTIPLMLPDNLVAECCACAAPVQHRPDVPKDVRKICLDCVMPELVERLAKNDLRVVTTRKAMDEVAAYRKKMGN